MEHYDVIIIGTGAGGGTLAAKLAPTGKKILILERGDYIPREKENWDTEEVFVKGRYTANEPWIDKDGEEFKPQIHYCVGGNTKFYGAALFRMREEDFGETRHEGGVSPAWPISYRDLQPYYLEAEKMYHVHGVRGSDPTEPPESEPYPLPPLKHEPSIQKLFDDIKTTGIKPFPLPIGVDLGAEEGVSPVILDRFDGFPDPTGSKGDSHVMGIKKAVKHDNVTLLTHALVTELRMNSEGTKITEVVTEIDGAKKAFSSGTVIVACGAINSAVLLLKSKSEKHPNGLANGSGLIGRHYMAHNNSAMLALSKTPNTAKFGKTFAINDFYLKGDD
uniref:GMC family oxidoreductase N-terminal domain-containing protein n=1 Tax=Persicitalea sp. TaxID=3100273 RepID=UPI00359310EB